MPTTISEFIAVNTSFAGGVIGGEVGVNVVMYWDEVQEGIPPELLLHGEIAMGLLLLAAVASLVGLPWELRRQG